MKTARQRLAFKLAEHIMENYSVFVDDGNHHYDYATTEDVYETICEELPQDPDQYIEGAT